MTASYAVPDERSFSRRQKRTTMFMNFELVGRVILFKIYYMVRLEPRASPNKTGFKDG